MAYWLMKSEPDVYSIDDLASKKGPDLWEGCRNFTVRNFFRDTMKVGDLAFFYNSSCPVPGVAGIMKVVREAYPDPTQFDPKSHYYDPTSREERPKWYGVDVEFVEKFDRVVSLKELKEMPGLEKMLVNRKGQRLSVMPVTDDEWKIVVKMAKNG
jgi:predicted RNA-binding protein with PUA-like domain